MQRQSAPLYYPILLLTLYLLMLILMQGSTLLFSNFSNIDSDIRTQIANIGSFFIMVLAVWITETIHRRLQHPPIYVGSIAKPSGYTLLYGLLLWVLAIPLVYLTGYWSSLLDYVALLGEWGQKLSEIETAIDQQLQSTLLSPRLSIRILVLTSVCLCAPIGEEILFRGALQKWCITCMPHHKHLALLLTAIIFSAAHFQFSGFIPRIILGLVLGYAALYGGLYLSILLHILNNLSTLLLFYQTHDLVQEQHLTHKEHIIIIIVAIVTLPALLFTLRRMRSRSSIK